MTDEQRWQPNGDSSSRAIATKGSAFESTKGARPSDAASAPQGLTETVKGLANQAGEKLHDVAETEKKVGVDFANGIAGAIRRAANEFEGDVPQVAPYIRGAADQIDYLAQVVRRRDVNQLVADVQDFARRQPTAFLGATLFAGFLVVRFLKSSTGTPRNALGSNPTGSRAKLAS